MNRIQIYRGTGPSLVACCLAAAPLLGQSFSTTVLTTTPIANDTKTDWSGSLAFPKFDVRGATLDSVTFSFSETLSTTLNFNNYANGDRAFAVADVTSQLTTDDSSFIVPGSLPSTSLHVATPITPKGSSSSAASSTTQTTTLTFDSPSLLAQWVGPGNFVVPIETESDFSITAYGGNNSTGLDTTAGATGSVTYNYHKGPQGNTAVPEPSSYALTIGSTLVGFGMVRRLSRLRTAG